MALLTTKQTSLAGALGNAVAAAAGGDKAANTTGLCVVIINTDAAAKTVTVASQVTTRPGLQKQDLVVTIPPGDFAVLRFNGAAEWSDGSGQVGWTYSAVTGVKVAAIQV